ncbi:MAG: LAGLIDADG family homing endonuclease [Candidatus Odinarchaeia archaeon]
MEEVEKAYVAGFIDGEGCIGIYKTKSGCVESRFSMTNSNKEVLLWIKKKLGLNNKIRHIHKEAKKPRYQLDIAGNQKVSKILKIFLPYLKIKREHALLVIELSELKKKGMKGYKGKRKLVNPARQIEIFERLKTLNAR